MCADAPRVNDTWYYEYTRKHKFSTFFPGDYSVVRGTIDSHFHAYASFADPLAQAKHASQAGMRALVIKSSAYPTVESARIVNEVLDEWAKPLGISPTLCFGGIVLGMFTGGINVEFAKAVVEKGAKVIWFPVLTSAHHLMKTRKISLEEAKREGVYILNDGELVPEALGIVELAARNNIMLSFGHLSREEMFALAYEVHSRGFKKALIDHPLNPATGLSVADIVTLAGMGVNMNFTWFELSPYCGVPAPAMLEAIKAVGADRTILSSDGGRRTLPDSVESMRLFAEMLSLFEFDKQTITQIMSANPAKLLNL